MAPKIHEFWQDLINELSLDLSQRLIQVTSDQIHDVLHEEPRNLGYLDERAKVPPVLQNAGLFVLPVQNKVYTLVRGEGYHDIEPVDTPIEEFPSRLPFPLKSAGFGVSEIQYILHAFNCGLLEHFVGGGQLFHTISGRKRSLPFSFKVGADITINQNGVQIETDAGFEGKDVTVIIEAKPEQRSNFIIRQLYYPYRLWSEVTKKRTIPLFFQYDPSSQIYTFREYGFADDLSYNSIKLKQARRYRISEQENPHLDINHAPLGMFSVPASNVDALRHEMPQANNVDWLLNFPFYVAQGATNFIAIAELQESDERQSHYTRQAMELLGFLEERRAGLPYQLTPLGQHYISLNAAERNELMMRRMFTLPIMHEILIQLLLRPSHMLSAQELDNLVRQFGIRIGNSTIGRRRGTIRAWLRWMAKTVGGLKIDNKRISLPLIEQGQIPLPGL